MSARLHGWAGAASRNATGGGGAGLVSGVPRFPLVILVLFMVVCTLGGGSSRIDVPSLLYVRPAAILAICLLLAGGYLPYLRQVRPLLLLLGCFAGWMVIQLIPLPPALWTLLPGHGQYAELATIAGVPQPWRPIALSTDRALAGLLALMPALVILLGWAAIDPSGRLLSVPMLLLIIGGSALLGVAQVSTGSGPAYLYQLTNEGSAVGIFANRNHQALLLAIGFPLLRLWTLLPRPPKASRHTRNMLAIALALFLIPMIVVTGSRAGLLLGVAGIVFAVLLAPGRIRFSKDRRWRLLQIAALILVPVILVVLALSLGRAVALERLATQELGQDLRWRLLPITLQVLKDFMPFGTGFGAFDLVFRGYETDAVLRPTYFNHAHNELLELAITGGLPAILILAAFLVWVSRQLLRSVWPKGGRDEFTLLARTGLIIIALIFFASVVDYPLRTPFFAALFALACCWAGAAQMSAKR